MFLSHKFRSCLTEQMIFLACKKRSSQIWRISVFENRNLKLISPFLISCRKHCSKFIRCSRFLRWTWRQAFSSRVISLSTLCTCSSLLYHCSKFPRCNWCSRWLTILSILSIQWWSQHFSKFAIFKIRVCNALVWVIVGMHLWLEVGRLCTNFSKLIQIFGDGILVVISHKSFLYLRRICSKIPSKLYSSGLEVLRLDRFGVWSNRFGLVTRERWDLCWSATLSWNIAG